MMDRSDRHFRYLLRLIAPHAWLYTEMITARALIEGDTDRLLKFDAIEHPVAVQLGGNDPRELAAAARLAARAGYDEINLNVGCPSSRVQAGSFGARLMLEPERVANCVASMRDAVELPVTVKTRLGVDDHDSYEFLVQFASCVIGAGCECLVVHARKAWLNGLNPKQNREVPPLDYGRVYRLKAQFQGLEVIINGGFSNLGDTLDQLSHVDGVMLGRAACNDPMLVGAIDRELNPHGEFLAKDAVLQRFLAYVEAQLRIGTPLKVMTRHLMGLFTGQPGARHWRRHLSLLEDGFAGLDQLISYLESEVPQRDYADKMHRGSGTGYNATQIIA